MTIRRLILVVCLLAVFSTAYEINGQPVQYTANTRDQTLRGSGRINPSTLAMEFDLPLAAHPGRGINVPISLRYSSKVWRIKYTLHEPFNASGCYSKNRPEFAEKSASGWTTSLAVPFIDYESGQQPYDINGDPYNADSTVACDPANPNNPPPYYIPRLTLNLPSGEVHELRRSDSPTLTNTSWDGTYYAVDSSNIIYIQNAASGIYRALMPDGSFYDFSASGGYANSASKYTDRNGNFTTYHPPDSTYPNGYWTDTLGRTLPIPLQPTAPGSPGPQTYSVPGIDGPIDYIFHWKQLRGSSQENSAVTDFNDPEYNLKYWGDKYLDNGQWETRTSGFLFGSEWEAWIVTANAHFNPVVLTQIELPTGGSYRFTYNVYGEIERIYYPTGGEERFQHNVVGSVSHLEAPFAQANRGVTDRKVYQTAGTGTPYDWDYETDLEAPNGFVVRITNPDETKTERFLHRSFPDAYFGFDNAIGGMAYKELTFADDGSLVGQKLTSWTKSGGERHPRVDHEETTVFDSTGDGVSTTTKYWYEGNLTLKETPVLVNKTTQYAFVPIEGGSSLNNPNDPPDPEPTPIPTPSPSAPAVKIVESTYLINDPNYASVKSYYTAQNMIGLVTVSKIKNGAGIIQAQSEMVYDEPERSPGYRGNPTTSKVWDSTKGAETDPNAYILTRARFDTYGNQYESTDANGNVSQTVFTDNYSDGVNRNSFAFPTKTISSVPDPSGTNGSNTAFETTVKYDFTTGLPTSTTDANGLETRIEYDEDTLRPLNTKTFYDNVQVGSTSETIYHDEPNNYWVKNRTQIDADKWAESITYFDGLGRAWKSEEVNSQGNIFVEKEFDAEGRVSRVTNPFRANETRVWTTNVYDEASRVKEVILQDGATVKTDYGVSIDGTVGVTKQITDQAGKKRKGVTDALGRMIQVIEDPTGQNLATDYLFDTLGNLRKTTQGVQNRYFMHDSLGRLLRAKQPEQEVNTNLALPTADPVTGHNQWSVGYSYDDNGNILTTTDAKDKTVSATYDNLNRLKVRDYSDTSMPDVEFYYDGKYRDITDTLQTASGSVKGKTTGIKSSVSRTNFTEFDDLGRLKTHQQITDGQTYATAYTYNLSGALIEETYPSGRVVKNTLGVDGELLQVQSKKNANFGFHTYAGSFTYDSSGAVTKMQLGNGRWETANYNNRLQVTQIGLGATDNAHDLLKLEYNYTTPSTTNNNGSLREQKITVPTVGGTSGFTATQTYNYDDLNRLQSAEEKVSGNTTWKQTFIIDRYGNRKFDAANTTTLGSCSTAICNPTANTSDNRFSTTDGYNYDKNGNVTEDAQGQRFGHDAENHQTAFFDASNSGSTPDATYYYDGDGKRVKKISATETTIFVYNAGGTLVAEYSTALATTQQVSYLTTDHLGSPRAITNENGAITTRKDFTAFGEENFTPERVSGLGYTGSGDETRKGYTGYEKDDESGLDFAQARYYNSGHGRYTSVDPLTASASIRNPQTFNRYSYVLNSPYKFTDPLGLLPLTSAGACGNFCANSSPTGGMIGLYSDNGLSGFLPDMTSQQSSQAPNPPAAEQNAEHAETNVKPGKINVGPVEVFTEVPKPPEPIRDTGFEKPGTKPASSVNPSEESEGVFSAAITAPDSSPFFVKVTASLEGDAKFTGENSVPSISANSANWAVVQTDLKGKIPENRASVKPNITISPDGRTLTALFAFRAKVSESSSSKFTIGFRATSTQGGWETSLVRGKVNPTASLSITISHR